MPSSLALQVRGFVESLVRNGVRGRWAWTGCCFRWRRLGSVPAAVRDWRPSDPAYPVFHPAAARELLDIPGDHHGDRLASRLSPSVEAIVLVFAVCGGF